jgi:hypothetical protein
MRVESYGHVGLPLYVVFHELNVFFLPCFGFNVVRFLPVVVNQDGDDQCRRVVVVVTSTNTSTQYPPIYNKLK